MHLFIWTLGIEYIQIKDGSLTARLNRKLLLDPFFLAPSTESKPPPPQSRRNTLSCLKGAEPSMLLSASTPDSISIVPGSEAASQLSSPAAGPSRSDTSGCHGRRGMMQAIKNERRASKVRTKCGGECYTVCGGHVMEGLGHNLRKRTFGFIISSVSSTLHAAVAITPCILF